MHKIGIGTSKANVRIFNCKSNIERDKPGCFNCSSYPAGQGVIVVAFVNEANRLVCDSTNCIFWTAYTRSLKK